jgi:glycosyltransferase involved in cell wall biosynthesis
MTEAAQRRPRLLVLTSTLPRWAGDSEPRFVFDLARALADRYDPLILAPMAPGAASREVMDGIPIRRFRYAPLRRWERLAAPGAIMPNLRRHPWLYLTVPGFFIGQLLALVSLLRRERFDLVHCHWLIPQGLVLALASLFVRVPPVLVTCHGADAFTLESGLLRGLKNWVLGKADAVSVVSREIAARLAGRSTGRLVHVPMGVDIGTFGGDAAPAAKPPIILCAGRLAAKKGVNVLIEALAEPRLASRDLRVRIVGDGPMKVELMTRADALGLGDRVQFVGAVPHERLAEEMEAATMFCAPYVIAADGDREGTPTVLLEAAAAGLPIVTSDVGGCGDIVEHGRSGWLLPPGDAGALAAAIAEALDDPVRAAAMAAAARRRAEDFSWPRIAARYAAILDDLSMKAAA